MGNKLAIDVLEKNNCPECGEQLRVEGMKRHNYFDWESINFVNGRYQCPACEEMFTIDVGDRGGGEVFRFAKV